ncbi:MAG: hypothetical protein CMR00_12995 [[Chlorobium] sp. 445]|nr:MAG: hypothetical protein CMR00_12995 [[Chlorobium] sp. 445]
MSDRKRPPAQSTRPPRLTDVIADAIESSYRDISAIISAKIDLAKLDLAEIIAGVAASLLVAIIALISTAYLMIAVALLIGEWLGKPSLGFLTLGILTGLIAVYFVKVSPNTLKNFFWKLISEKLDELEQQRPHEEV